MKFDYPPQIKESVINGYGHKTNLSPLGGIFNFIVCMVGTAMVATAYSFSLTTPYFGIILDILLGLWAASAAICIFNSACITNATSFIDLGRILFGKDTIKQKLLVFIFILLPTFINNIGALAAYITIASSAVETYVDLSPNAIQLGFTVVMFLLGIIRSYKNTQYISTITLFVFLLAASCIVITSVTLMFKIEFQDQNPFNFSLFIQAIPILAFAMNGHPTLIGMAGEMVPSVQRVFPKYLVCAQFLVVALNCTMGFFPSILFGKCTQSDSIVHLSCFYQLVFQTRSIAIIIAQISIGIALIIQAPLYVIPLKEFILDSGTKTIRDRSYLMNAFVSLVVASIAGILGILLGNITDTLNVAATVGSLLMLGPTAGIVSLMAEKTRFAKIRAWLNIIFGLIFILINIYTIFKTFQKDPIDEDLMCLCEN